MKNLIKTFYAVAFSVCLVLSASAYSPPGMVKSEMTNIVKHEKTPAINVCNFQAVNQFEAVHLGVYAYQGSAYAVMVYPVPIPKDLPVKYLQPVNDCKPDNTNVQIWRQRILNLRTSMISC